jgi:hypothetical protein
MTDVEKSEYETCIQSLMSEVERLQAVVAKLTEGTDDAHTTLRRLYLDEKQSSNTRIKAAIGALHVEKPSLRPQSAPLELTAEPVEDLAELVARQRRRAYAMQREARDIEVSPSGVVRVLPKPGNGQDDSSGGD